MADSDGLKAELEMLRARLSGLTEAILRINEHLELDTVLQEVVDSARTLTGARYAMISAFDNANSGGGGLEFGSRLASRSRNDRPCSATTPAPLV